MQDLQTEHAETNMNFTKPHMQASNSTVTKYSIFQTDIAVAWAHMVELPGFFAISWKRCRDHSHLEVLAKAPKKATLPNCPQLPAKCQGQGGGQAGHIGQMMSWRYPKSRSHIVQPVEPENAWSLKHDSTIINSIRLYQPPCTFLPAFLQTRSSSSSYSWWHLDLGIRWRGTMRFAMRLPSRRHPWRHWTSSHPSPTSWIGRDIDKGC